MTLHRKRGSYYKSFCRPLGLVLGEGMILFSPSQLVPCQIGLRLCAYMGQEETRARGGEKFWPGFGLGYAFRWMGCLAQNGIREMATSVRIALRWHSRLGFVWADSDWDDLREYPRTHARTHGSNFLPPQANLPIALFSQQYNTHQSNSLRRDRLVKVQSVRV